ncbi:MAG: hypothetical protein ACFFFG_03345 [Candidatus Thorarchaeota archaeon]
MYLLKKTMPNLQIGAIDVLGNADTRRYVDWAFSVEKQVINKSLWRLKHRSLEEYLYELTQVMLEEISFDLVIPSSPLQTKLHYLERFSNQIEVFMPERSTLEQTSDAFKFINNLSVCCPTFFRSLDKEISASEISHDSFPGVFITKVGSFFVNEKTALAEIYPRNLKGFYLTTSQIQSACFLVSGSKIQFMGVQTLKSPHQHALFPDFLEQNSLIPYSGLKGPSILAIKQAGENIIQKLDLTGIITLYFYNSSRQPVPISCNPLPDENFGLWARKNPRLVIKFMTTSLKTLDRAQLTLDYAYRIPIHSRHPLQVPFLPEEISNQRNLAGVLSHPEYPICVISGSKTSHFEAKEHRMQSLLKMTRILEPNSQHSAAGIQSN